MRKRRTQRDRRQFALMGMQKLKDRRLYTGIIATMKEHEALMQEYGEGTDLNVSELITNIKSLHHIK